MVRKKKEVVRPVVAKPLNDNQKRNLVTSFVTNNINENVTSTVTKDSLENLTNISTESVTENVNNGDTYSVTSKITNYDTESVTNNGTKKLTKKDTKSVTKKVTVIKSITLGKKDIIAKFTSDKKLRPNYNLSEDTIEKIEKISDILGYKKAEFVDIYLNGTLDKVLKYLEKIK